MMRVNRFVILLLWAVLLAGCGVSGSHEVVPGAPLTLALAVAGTSATTTTISLTSNFNCIDCPIYKNGIIYTKVTTESNVPCLFVVGTAQDCYRAGGLFLLGGNVWSNTLCL